MTDSFKGSEYVNIQPGDANVPVSLRLVAATNSTSNDGSMPFGSTVVSAVVTAKTAAGIATTDLVSSSTESGNTIIAYLSYSTDLTKGLYNLTAKVTMSISGSILNMTREYDLNRIYVKDR